MGKLNQFSIIFASPTGVFFGGQVIEGQVLLHLNEPMKMRGLRLRFQGQAHVHWSEQHSTGSGKNRRTVTRHYSSHENYFDHILVLYGKAPGVDGDNPVHPAGQYSYPFQFQVPPGVPSSFEEHTGRVRYTIEGRIDKPWKFDHTTKAAFTVINMLDLNREHMALSCPQGQNSKTLCCLCCKSGPIEAVCRLDRMGFVPGDFITINAEITNGSSRKMSRSFAQLIQVITFHATTKSKSSVRVVAHKDYPEIAPGRSDTWAGERLHIPPLPPSRLDGCRIIDIKYVLKFCVDPSGPGFDLEIPLEVLIGSIPHQQVLQRLGQFPPGAAAAVPAPAMPGPSPPGAVPPGFMPPPNYNTMGQPPPMTQPSAPLPPPDMPPPSYAECEFSRVNIREEGDTDYTKGNLDFAPKYTYYDWGNNGNK